jgi:c-di-GMP-related signal transduction protein
MEIFIARQPILNAHKRLFAYELLYRGTRLSNLDNTNGNRATASVLTSAFLTEGLSIISGLRPCFINFTRDLLLRNLPASFPANLLVVEILEDVPPTPEILAVCKKLKEGGYRLALDDFIYHRALEPLLALADIVKIDLRLTPLDSLLPTLRHLSNHNLKLLAEKVETYREFEQASKLGFTYFQGYFFSKPEHLKIREIASTKINLVQLLAEASSTTTTVKRLQTIIERDLGIAYKLLRYVNSSYFYRLSKVESVGQAIAYLGEREMRRFLLLVLISEICSDKPEELVRLAMVRAKTGEGLALAGNMAAKSDEIFLFGLLSLLDAMLDSSMAHICERLSLSDHLKNGLIHGAGPYAPFLRVIIAHEIGDEAACRTALDSIGVSPEDLQQCYLQALTFVEQVHI